MSLLLEALRALGVGGSLMIAAVLVVAALYLRKGASAATTVATLAASTTTYVVVSLVVLALAIGAGWLKPNPEPFLAFANDAIEAGLDIGVDLLESAL
ncbi:hypothetical protein [Haloplanus natans]|uniref:hypothetical protein n=1 Tax=Haloplanus natans TaxID=376171 RepID=UPI000677EE5B|nr:hypothetical protein [Haloplanus natans]